MQFTKPTLDTSDPLALAIANDNQVHDNTWVLDEEPDADALAAFWTQVRDEARQDPSWTFVDES